MLALAFVTTVDVRAQHAASRAAGAQRAELVRIVQERQARELQLERNVGALQARLDRAVAQGAGSALQAMIALQGSLGTLAGVSGAQGPGLVVRVSDASGARPGDADRRVQDVDLQSIVNELWADGAEAIAIGGQRIVSTTAIRNAGDAVLVNFQVLTSPYLVEAIAPPATRARFSASKVANTFGAWKDLYGLGFAISGSDALSIPAFGGALRFRYAHASVT